ncbi:unnamed protein product [Pelagomonas calceolata]|uniref:MalT-like TPR region domain-containing protein n=1 Tax=Pelagomonas calceolata TaxID=35677 RepID=A0A8J2SUJ0_9STRA|nr:unnamed protein product [Pelagomonas calceolata]
MRLRRLHTHNCVAEQAKILVAEAEENNKRIDSAWLRWRKCSLCGQNYHGVVACALGWACWKTYVDRSETDEARKMAINVLGNGLYEARHYEESLSVKEAELSMRRRVGASKQNMLGMQNNLAGVYRMLGRDEHATRMLRDIYSGRLKLHGEEHKETFGAALNYASSLVKLLRFEEAKSLLRRTMPVTRRVLGDTVQITLKMRLCYAFALYKADSATLGDLREALATQEDTERIARRVYGGAHPMTTVAERDLRNLRAALRARETSGIA